MVLELYFKKIVILKIPSSIAKSESEVAQSCLTLCNPMDCSLPGSSLHGILQARILEWVAIFLLQGIFLTQGLEPRSSAFKADALTSEPPGHTNNTKQKKLVNIRDDRFEIQSCFN